MAWHNILNLIWKIYVYYITVVPCDDGAKRDVSFSFNTHLRKRNKIVLIYWGLWVLLVASSTEPVNVAAQGRSVSRTGYMMTKIIVWLGDKTHRVWWSQIQVYLDYKICRNYLQLHCNVTDILWIFFYVTCTNIPPLKTRASKIGTNP